MNRVFALCPLRSGSSGCVSFVRAGDTRLLVDCGHSARAVAEMLAAIGESIENINGILITHEHSDHIKGAGMVAKKYGVPIYANSGTWKAMRTKPGFESVNERLVRVFRTDEDFFINEAEVSAFAIPHDAASPVGYSIMYAGRKITLATDIGHVDASWLSKAEESDVILIESNHDTDMLMNCSYPAWLKKRIAGRLGHLSNADCGGVLAHLAKGGIRRFILAHMSEEANLPEIAIERAMEQLARYGASADAAYRDKAAGMYNIG